MLQGCSHATWMRSPQRRRQLQGKVDRLACAPRSYFSVEEPEYIQQHNIQGKRHGCASAAGMEVSGLLMRGLPPVWTQRAPVPGAILRPSGAFAGFEAAWKPYVQQRSRQESKDTYVRMGRGAYLRENQRTCTNGIQPGYTACCTSYQASAMRWSVGPRKPRYSVPSAWSRRYSDPDVLPPQLLRHADCQG